MSNTIETRLWRYATKQFDASKEVSADDLKTILEAGRLSPSSYGLQPYHIFVITDPKLREKLKEVSWNQPQITDASHLLVLANFTDFGEELVDDYIQNVVDTRNNLREDLEQYANTMKNTLSGLSQEQKAQWAAKQTYLALGNLLQAAAELRIDACPMEGFQNEKYNEILELDKKNLNAAVLLTVGYRSSEDALADKPKVRKPMEVLYTYL